MIYSWPIIGHQKIVNYLQQSIKRQRISHAYLFYGPENIGKKSLAKYFSQSLICDNTETKPCHRCLSCQQFLKNIHPEVVWVRREQDKKNISIDQIRELKEKIYLSGFTNGYKVIIIVNAEEISKEAANSFLKILEEPPLKCVIIILANKLKNIPETILSRCQTIKFSLVSKKEIANFLKKEYKINQEKTEELSSLALGLPGRANKFFQNKNLLAEYLEQQEKLIKIINADLGKKLKIAKEISASASIDKIISHWKIFIRDLILYKTDNKNLIVNISLKSNIKKIAEQLNFEKLYYLEQELNKLTFYFGQNINIGLALDNFVININ